MNIGTAEVPNGKNGKEIGYSRHARAQTVYTQTAAVFAVSGFAGPSLVRVNAEGMASWSRAGSHGMMARLTSIAITARLSGGYSLAPLVRSMRLPRRFRARLERRFSGEVTHAKMMNPAAASSPKKPIQRIEAQSIIGTSPGQGRSGTGLLDKREESGPRAHGDKTRGPRRTGPSANAAILSASKAIRHLVKIRRRAT
jgi:hypothetical protein